MNSSISLTNSVSVLSWKYLPPWTLRHYCWVGLHDGRVVGYVVAVPLRGIVGGREVAFFQLADMMAPPDPRPKHDYFGLGTRAILEDIGRSHPEHLLYGFSNHRAFRWLERIGLSGLVEKAGTRIVGIEAEESPGAYAFRDWEWSEPDPDDKVEGLASEFCHVVTQGRNIADTKLEVVGETARKWMSIAQCFAGGPEEPPAPGQRT